MQKFLAPRQRMSCLTFKLHELARMSCGSSVGRGLRHHSELTALVSIKLSRLHVKRTPRLAPRQTASRELALKRKCMAWCSDRTPSSSELNSESVLRPPLNPDRERSHLRRNDKSEPPYTALVRARNLAGVRKMPQGAQQESSPHCAHPSSSDKKRAFPSSEDIRSIKPKGTVRSQYL